jgi:predicted HicB family RNase H-like nuclease
MIIMKHSLIKPNAKPNEGTRSVKVADAIHHRLRILAAQKRMTLQDFLHQMLVTAIKRKVYDETAPE